MKLHFLLCISRRIAARWRSLKSRCSRRNPCRNEKKQKRRKLLPRLRKKCTKRRRTKRLFPCRARLSILVKESRAAGKRSSTAVFPIRLRGKAAPFLSHAASVFRQESDRMLRMRPTAIRAQRECESLFLLQMPRPRSRKRKVFFSKFFRRWSLMSRWREGSGRMRSS